MDKVQIDSSQLLQTLNLPAQSRPFQGLLLFIIRTDWKFFLVVNYINLLQHLFILRLNIFLTTLNFLN